METADVQPDIPVGMLVEEAPVGMLVEEATPGAPNPLSAVQKAHLAMGKDSKPVPVTVLSGFLGAGKTTMLKHLLQNRDGVRIALVVNDMAAVNVDAELVREGGVLKQEEKMVELSNGCICCTLREDLLTSLAALAAEQRFDHVLVESSGISEPLPVAETFTFADHTSGASLSDVARLHNLVTVVDAASMLEQLASVESLVDRGWQAGEGDARSVAGLLVDQLEFADVLVVNKADLLRSEQMRTLEALLRRLNPKAEILQTEFGRVDPGLLLGKARFSLRQAEAHPQWLVEAREHEHTPETIEFGISSFIFRPKRPFNPQRLHEALGTRPLRGPLSRLLRVKGAAWLSTGNGQQASIMLGHLALAGTQFSVTPIGLWWATSPRNTWPEGLEESIQAVFHEQDGGRQTELVCIGQELDHAAAAKALEQCLLSEQEMAAGAAAFSREGHQHFEALVLSALNGNLEVAKQLVEQGKADPKAAQDDGWTALMSAALHGHLEVAKFLVEEGKADPMAATNKGWTAQMMAAKNGHVEVTKWLVEQGKADPVTAAKDHLKALMLASEGGHLAVAKVLVEEGMADPNGAKKDGWTPLMAAALKGHMEVAKYLVEGKADPRAATKDGWTVLMAAAQNGHLQVAKWLVEHCNADPKGTKIDGWTVVMAAAQNGHLEMVTWLVEEGKADPTTANDDLNALMLAALNGHLEMAKWLVDEGKVDRNAATKNGATALMAATGNGQLELVKWLIEEGKADPNATGNRLDALQLATESEHLELVQWLVKEGKVDPRTPQEDGSTFVMAAAQNGHLQVVKWLVEEGKADPKATKKDGWTALMAAALDGHLQAAKWLAEEGNVDPKGATSKAVTALMAAAQNGHLEVVQWLMEGGKADPAAAEKDSFSALMMAALNGHLAVVKWLVKEGKTDPKAAKEDGSTALMAAAANGQWEVAMWLVEEGKVDPMAATNDGKTAAIVAAQGGFEEMSKWLAT